MVVAALCAAGSFAPARADEPWQRATVPAEAAKSAIRDVSFIDAEHGWAVGDGGLCLRTGDGGKTWESVTTGSKADLRRIRFTDANNGWICGDGDPNAPEVTRGHTVMLRPNHQGTMLHTTDGGKSWESAWIKTNFLVTGLDVSAAPAVL